MTILTTARCIKRLIEDKLICFESTAWGITKQTEGA